jgi:hypothetical protein
MRGLSIFLAQEYLVYRSPDHDIPIGGIALPILQALHHIDQLGWA